jgi:putative phage-type endonuclease
MTDLKALLGETCDIEEYDRRDLWLEARKHGIGASDLPIILGLSKWTSPLALWGLKTGVVLNEEADDENEAAEWGLLLEPVVKRRYMDRTGRALAGLGPYTILRSKAHPWMCASPDDLILPGDGRPLGTYEGKTASAFKREDWADEPPLPYLAQKQWQFAVAGLTWGGLACLLGGQKLVWADVERNDRFIAVAMEKASAFWTLVQR